MALRLASRLLRDDRSSEYIHTMSDGPLYEFHPDHSIGARIPEGMEMSSYANSRLTRHKPNSTAPNAPGSRISYAVRHRSRQILHSLTDVLDAVEIAQDPDATDCTGLSHQLASSNVLGVFPNIPKGRKIRIVLSQHTAFTPVIWQKDSALSLTRQVGLAVCLVHEVAHVLNMAIQGERALFGRDYFYQDACCNEAGFNLENILFGGILTFRRLQRIVGHPIFVHADTADEDPLLESYPSAHVYDEYVTPTHTMMHCNSPPSDCRLIARFPRQFASSLFTENFWTRHHAARRNGQIQPSALDCWVFKDVKAGESYIDQSGLTIQVAIRTTVPCSLLDPNLPTKERRLLEHVRDHGHLRT